MVSWFKKVFNPLPAATDDGQASDTSASGQVIPPLSDGDYEFLLGQLLEGIRHAWHVNRIEDFIRALGDRGKPENWAAWLHRYRKKVMEGDNGDRQSGLRLMVLAEATQGNRFLREIHQTAQEVGQQILTGSSESVVWEYDGPDLVPTVNQGAMAGNLPQETPTPVPQNNAPVTAESVQDKPPQPPAQESLTLDELRERLETDAQLRSQINRQLQLEDASPQEIVDTLVARLTAEQQKNQQKAAALPTQPETDDFVGWFQLGIKQADGQQFASAIASWRRALDFNPHSGPAWHNLGSALAHLGQLDEAITSFEKAIAINPQDVQAWINQGQAFFHLQRWSEALDCWDNAVNLQPDLFQVWFQRSNALQQLKQTEGAIASLHQCLKIKPDFPPAQEALQKLQSP